MHDVDWRMVKSQTLQRNIQLGCNGTGQAVGCVGTLDDGDHIFGNTTTGDPLSQDFFMVTTAIDKACVEGIAASFHPGIPDQCARCDIILVVTTNHQLADGPCKTGNPDFGDLRQARRQD